jgi:hypothetical protein
MEMDYDNSVCSKALITLLAYPVHVEAAARNRQPRVTCAIVGLIIETPELW